MRVLLMTAMWPTPANPAFGSFVYAQARCLQQAGVDVEPLVLEGRSRKLIYPRGVVRLHQRLSSGPVDLIHAHYGYVGWVARLQWRTPVVVTYHGDDVLGTVDGSGAITTTSRIAAHVCTRLGRLVDAVIVQSSQMAARFPNANVHVIPHEVELNVFQPVGRDIARQMLGLNRDAQYMLFAANPNVPVKRFPLAREAAELVRRRRPNSELLVVWKEPQDRLALYMNACDVLVFPSYQEGSPNIVKQAMACNLPVVATDVGDVREVIGGVEGCQVCPPDAFVIAGAIEDIFNSTSRTQGRKHVQRLSGPYVAKRIVQVYEDVLGARARLPGKSLERVH